MEALPTSEKRNLDPKKWGPLYWSVIHTYASKFPEFPTLEDQLNAKKFYTDFIDKLPCKVCGDSYAIFIKRMPIDTYLDTRDSLMLWTYNMHCTVNEKLRMHGQPKKPDPTWNEFCKRYNPNCYPN